MSGSAIDCTLNDIEITKNFERLFAKKKKSGQRYIVDRTKEVIIALSEAVDPGSVGEKKKGRPAFWSCRLNDSSRLVYDFKKVNGKISVRLLRVCDHKQSYDRD